jgi:hypothetical protein
VPFAVRGMIASHDWNGSDCHIFRASNPNLQPVHPNSMRSPAVPEQLTREEFRVLRQRSTLSFLSKLCNRYQGAGPRAGLHGN